MRRVQQPYGGAPAPHLRGGHPRFDHASGGTLPGCKWGRQQGQGATPVPGQCGYSDAPPSPPTAVLLPGCGLSGPHKVSVVTPATPPRGQCVNRHYRGAAPVPYTQPRTQE